MQNPDNKPETDTEKFFRQYTQGIHYVYNRKLRTGIAFTPQDEIELEYTQQIIAAIDEIKANPIPQDIVTYRFVKKEIFRRMREWGDNKKTLLEKAFLSTTLCPQNVMDRDYSQGYYRILKIYIPKGTPGVYLDLISDMSEREVLLLPNIKLSVLKASFLSKQIECIVYA